MVFCRLHRRFPCFCATVNGLTTNRLDLHRITNAFTTNLFVCDQASTSVPLFPPSAIPPSIYLSQLRGLSPLLSSRFAPVEPIPAKISGPGRVVDWKSAIPVAATFIDVNLLSDVADLNDRFEVKACFGIERVFFLIFRDDFD